MNAPRDLAGAISAIHSLAARPDAEQPNPYEDGQRDPPEGSSALSVQLTVNHRPPRNIGMELALAVMMAPVLSRSVSKVIYQRSEWHH